jgi:hypothetical protein
VCIVGGWNLLAFETNMGEILGSFWSTSFVEIWRVFGKYVMRGSERALLYIRQSMYDTRPNSKLTSRGGTELCVFALCLLCLLLLRIKAGQSTRPSPGSNGALSFRPSQQLSSPTPQSKLAVLYYPPFPLVVICLGSGRCRHHYMCLVL